MNKDVEALISSLVTAVKKDKEMPLADKLAVLAAAMKWEQIKQRDTSGMGSGFSDDFEDGEE